MLMKSYIHFSGKMGFSFRKKGSATLTIGDHPRVRPLKELEIDPHPLMTCFIPEASGILDDYFESWFLTDAQQSKTPPEGLESVTNLGLGQEWLEPPKPIDAAPAATQT